LELHSFPSIDGLFFAPEAMARRNGGFIIIFPLMFPQNTALSSLQTSCGLVMDWKEDFVLATLFCCHGKMAVVNAFDSSICCRYCI
jgi:hypothetical protein